MLLWFGSGYMGMGWWSLLANVTGNQFQAICLCVHVHFENYFTDSLFLPGTMLTQDIFQNFNFILVQPIWLIWQPMKNTVKSYNLKKYQNQWYIPPKVLYISPVLLTSRIKLVLINISIAFQMHLTVLFVLFQAVFPLQINRRVQCPGRESL